jgi:hypothetical protein
LHNDRTVIGSDAVLLLLADLGLGGEKMVSRIHRRRRGLGFHTGMIRVGLDNTAPIHVDTVPVQGRHTHHALKLFQECVSDVEDDSVCPSFATVRSNVGASYLVRTSARSVAPPRSTLCFVRRTEEEPRG